MRSLMIQLEYLIAAALVGVCVGTSILCWSHLLGWTLSLFASFIVMAAAIGLSIWTLPPRHDTPGATAVPLQKP